MKITVENKDFVNVKVGDFLLIQDDGRLPELRQIVKIKNLYVGIDVETGEGGFTEDSIDELYREYVDCYDEVTIIKNSNIEIIVGGK